MKSGQPDRLLMKIVHASKKGDHTVARLFARQDGLKLVVPHSRIFDLDDDAGRGYSAGVGDGFERLLLDDPVYGSAGLTVVCAKCGFDFHLIPHEIQRHYRALVERKVRRKQLVVEPRKDTRRHGY